MPAREICGRLSDRTMSIVVMTVGQVGFKNLDALIRDLSEALGKRIFPGKSMPDPDFAFNPRRNQWRGAPILEAILDQKAYTRHERILGIVDRDLYEPGLNFVFGLAADKAAVISLTRLRQEYYGLPEDSRLFCRRVLTEAIHELGHTYGLHHCQNPACVMFFSLTLADTDRKGWEMCSECAHRFKRHH